MGLGKKHEIKPDLKNGLHIISGIQKIGKTDLTVKIAEHAYGSREKLLMISIKNERAYEGKSGIMYEEPQTWKELMNIINSLLKDTEGYDVVSFDVMDWIIPLGEEEIMRQHTVETKQKPKSFNSCFGGYGEPRKRLNKLIDEFVTKVQLIEAMTILVSHSKPRNIKSKLGEDEYTILSTNLSFDNFHAFSYRALSFCNITNEVQVEENLLKDKERIMYFRGDTSVEAGGRLEYIVEKSEYSAENYCNAILDAMKREFEEHGSIGKQKDRKKEVVEEYLEVEDASEAENNSEEKIARIDDLLEVSKKVADSGVSNKVIMGVYKEYGIKNPKEFTDYKLTEKAIQDLKSLL